MVPTYFRRELRDRVLQRPSRLRTFVFCRKLLPSLLPPVQLHFSRHTPRKRGIQYAAASRSSTRRSGILDHPLSRVMTARNRDVVRMADNVIESRPSRRRARRARCVERRAARRRGAGARRTRAAVRNHARHRRLRLFADPQRNRSGPADAEARRAGRAAGAAGRDGARPVAEHSAPGRPTIDCCSGRSASSSRRRPPPRSCPTSCWCRWRRSIVSATASAMAPDITTTRWRICAKSKPSAAIGLAFAAQEIEAVPALGARRGAGLCANGNQDVRFPEFVICAFFSSATWSAGPGAPPYRNICPA